jgi:hypothetical protein
VRHEDLLSDESLSFVRRQLAICIDEHSLCQMPLIEQAYMPTRILDIGVSINRVLDIFPEDTVKLVESIEVTGDRRYVSLSHRWNTSGRTIKTTRATYETHQAGIALEYLDVSYQAAVNILRALGVRYVWIDSLCIIQDSTEDWQAESQTMATVYNQALFTIAIHGDSAIARNNVKKPQICLVGELFTYPHVYAKSYIDHIWERSGSMRSPLLRRGWIYQERLLSPRVVHFTEDEISWECYEENSCQCHEVVPDPHKKKTSKTEHAEALRRGDCVDTECEHDIVPDWHRRETPKIDHA